MRGREERRLFYTFCRQDYTCHSLPQCNVMFRYMPSSCLVIALQKRLLDMTDSFVSGLNFSCLQRSKCTEHLGVCVCVCVCVCECECECICVFECVCVSVCVCLCVWVYMSVFESVCVFECVCVCVSECVCLSMCVWVCVSVWVWVCVCVCVCVSECVWVSDCVSWNGVLLYTCVDSLTDLKLHGFRLG
jgi:hypothetical protein